MQKRLIMKLVVAGAENKIQELIGRQPEANWIKFNNYETAINIKDADAYFFLDNNSFSNNYNFTNKPIFINAIAETLKDNNQPTHVLRFNGWSGWLQKDKWEVAGQLSVDALAILGHLNIEPISLPDEPGFISPAVISLIINEAFYAEAEKVSSREDIDLAMKLGTGYPFGPFEWAEKIGVNEVYELLLKLSKTEERYQPSEALSIEKNKK